MRFFKRLGRLEGKVLWLEEQHRQDLITLIRDLSKIESRLLMLEAAINAKDKEEK